MALTSRNNLIMNNGTEVQFNSGGANSDLDYDLIANTSGGTLIKWNGTNYASLSAFLARGGNTTWTHAVSSPAQFVDAAAGNVHLLTTSPALNAGSTVVLFNYDLQNKSRPQGSAWDIGAYEDKSGDIPPPLQLRIVK
jgi:hypothetical protein